MQALTKEVSRQDANFKLSPSTSNETSINLSKDISALISDESGDITFKIFKADFIKALSVLCVLPAVYLKKDERPCPCNEIFIMLSELINNEFEGREHAFYTVSHLKREDGRFYLNNLKKANGFNVRAFLIEQYSYLTFIKNDEGELILRLETIVPKEELSEDIKATIVETKDASVKKPLQQIYYGAPGTGKSYTIDKITTEKNSVRTTFHPDSDYASFVGAYKPTMEDVDIHYVSDGEVKFAVAADNEKAKKGKHSGKEKRIVYKYVPQAFLKAYVKAWGDLENPYYLIIEEINRGNCAQIFGDLFQLLDRNNMGASSYPILADEDITRFLNEDENGFAGLTEQQKNKISDFVLIKDSGERRDIGEDILKGKHLLLPPNLHIWATMNTSDQSLFPIDSAFKRRWDWEYMPIDYNPIDTNEKTPLNWKLKIGNNLYDWGTFLSKINPEIETLTESSDKQMGYFFVKANPLTGIISEEVFKNKVLFYLWTEVLKDFDMGKDTFINPETKKTFKFPDFFDSNQKAVVNFISNLKLSPLDDNQEELSIMGLEDNEISNTGINDERSSNLKEWRQRFWETVQERYRESGFDFSVSPTTRNYYQITTGVVDLNFINSVNKRDGSCWVGLYFEAKRAKELYPEILTHKEEIEKSIAFQLDWIANNEEHGYACIRVSKSGIDFDNIQQSEDTASWLAEHGIKIFNAFKPYFNRLK